jgi:putative endonuclease
MDAGGWSMPSLPYETISEAIRREKTLKRWHRAWKVRLIHAVNPDG